MVTLEELKAHLRIETDEEDGYLQSLLRMAEAAAADFCGQPFPEAPESARLAVLLFASYHYTHRESDDTAAYAAMKAAFQALLWPYRSPEALF